METPASAKLPVVLRHGGPHGTVTYLTWDDDHNILLHQETIETRQVQCVVITANAVHQFRNKLGRMVRAEQAFFRQLRGEVAE